MTTQDSDGADVSKPNEEPAASLGILDLVVVAAETLPLLVLGPLLTGVIAYFVVASRPPDYVAFSSFGTNAGVTQSVLQSMLNSDFGVNPSRSISIDPIAQMATITTHAPTAEQARSEVSAALDALALRPRLSSENAATVSATIKQNQERIASFQSLSDQLQATIGTASSEVEGQPSDNGNDLATFITLSDKLAGLTSANAELQRSLNSRLIDPLGRDVYLNKVQPSRLSPVVLSVLLVGLAIYLGALLRYLWRLASADPQSKPKVDRIRHSIRFSRPK